MCQDKLQDALEAREHLESVAEELREQVILELPTAFANRLFSSLQLPLLHVSLALSISPSLALSLSPPPTTPSYTLAHPALYG